MLTRCSKIEYELKAPNPMRCSLQITSGNISSYDMPSKELTEYSTTSICTICRTGSLSCHRLNTSGCLLHLSRVSICRPLQALTTSTIGPPGKNSLGIRKHKEADFECSHFKHSNAWNYRRGAVGGPLLLELLAITYLFQQC